MLFKKERKKEYERKTNHLMEKLYLDKFIKGKLMGKLMLKELKVVPWYVNQKSTVFSYLE